MGIDLHTVLSRLGRVKKSGAGFMALCPGHDDHEPSLSIKQAGNGKLLLHCFAGCHYEKILAALGIHNTGNDRPARDPEAVYDYTNESGQLLFQVCRFPGKDFKQRRPDGKDGWIWNLKGVRRVPYRLPELLKAEQVYIVEGERDADRLGKAGLVATCNSGGVGKWLDEYAEYLKDRDVVIIPDADEPGRSHADKVAGSVFPVARSLKVVDLSGHVGETGDVSDFLRSNTVKKFLEFVEASPVLTEAPEGGPEVDLQRWLDGELDYEKKVVVDHVMALDDLTYESVRDAVAKRLKFRVSKLDEWHEKRHGRGDTKETLASTSPWPHAVRLPEILDEIRRMLQSLIVLDKESAIATALWVSASWLYDRFEIFPYLLLASPTKRCGKTRLLGIIRHLVERPMQAASISAAALFRTVEARRPTLLLDEFDQHDRESELHYLLNSGHERSGAAIRLVPKGNDYIDKSFSTFCPKVIAMIGKPKDTLVDRSIAVPMQRRRPSDRIKRLDDEAKQALQTLQRKLARWKADTTELPEVEPLNTDNDRLADNWLPLLTVAEMAGEEWPELARQAASILSKDVEDDSIKIQLLQDIRRVFQEEETDKITTSDLLEKLKLMEESLWGEWNYGRGLSPRGLANLLRPFQIEPKVMRTEDKRARGYEFEDFRNAFEAYIPQNTPKLSVTSVTSLNSLDLQPCQKRDKPENVTDVSTNKNKDVTDVTDKIGGIGEHIPEKRNIDDHDPEKCGEACDQKRPPEPKEPCPVCGCKRWRWDGVGRLYKCDVCHPDPVRLKKEWEGRHGRS